MPAPAWAVSQVDKNCFDVTVSAKRNKSFEQWVLLAADHHFDSPKCKRELIKKHMELAKERGAVVCFIGDLFDVMGGKYDPRSSKGEIRKEYVEADYLDAVTQDAARFFMPYASNMAVICEGNHETKIKERHEVDLIQRFIALLNSGSKSNTKFGSYSGTIRFRFDYGHKVPYSITLAYHHGSGYKSPRKKEAFAYEHPDANICVFGHNHDFEKIFLGRHRVSKYGKGYRDHQTILGIPPYKDGYGYGDSGFEVQQGHRIKIQGAWWVRMFFNRSICDFDYECIEAR